MTQLLAQNLIIPDRMSTVPIATVIIPSVYHAQLQWFFEKNAPFVQNYHVIIVSSAVETTEAFLQKYLKHFSLISLSKPKGFAKTVNLGLRKAATDWVATCNDDVLLSKNWIEKLISVAGKKTAGINPVIMSPDGTVESAGIAILPIGKAEPLTDNIPSSPFQTEALNAACVVYRRSALESIGFFDERFDSYLEDIDVSLSLREAGWELQVVPDVRVEHLRHQTSKQVLGRKKSYLDARNWWLILAKHWSWQTWLKFFPGILLERARNISGMTKALMGGTSLWGTAVIIALLMLPLLVVYCFNLVGSYAYDNDFGRDLVDMYAIAQGNPTLLGPKLSFGGLHTGPYYYYLFAPLLLLWPAEPEALLYANAVLAWLALVVLGVIWHRQEKWPLKITLASLYWIGLSTYFVFSARGPGNAFSYVGWMAVLIGSFTTVWRKRTWWIWALYGFPWGVVVNFHLAVLFVALPLLSALVAGNVVLKRRAGWPDFRLKLAVFGGFVASFAPLLLFELTHGFVMIRNTFIEKSYMAFTQNTNLVNPLQTSDNPVINFWLFSTQAGTWVAPSFVFLVLICIVVLITNWKNLQPSTRALALSLPISLAMVAVMASSQLAFHYFFPFIVLAQVITIFLIAREKHALPTILLLVLSTLIFFPKYLYGATARSIPALREVIQELQSSSLWEPMTTGSVQVYVTREVSTAPIGHEYRYFLQSNGIKIDTPSLYASSPYMLWIVEQPLTDMDQVSSWELEQFGPRHLIDQTQIGSRTIYLFGRQ